MAPIGETTTEKKTTTGAADCASARCGVDAGCKQEADGSWICICTHDLSPPRPDGSCPRFVVTGPHHRHPTKKALITIRRSSDQAPLLPPPRHFQTPPTQQVISSDTASASNALFWLLPLIGIAITAMTAFWLRKRLADRKSRRQASRAGPAVQQPHRHTDDDLIKPVLVADEAPVCLTKSVLHRERFTSNPEYDWGTDTGHLLAKHLAAADETFKSFSAIRPEWIELELEIGEGCFGKVFRGRLQRPGSAAHEAVAIKVLKSAAGPAAHDDLIQEAEIMASFCHENILSLKGIVANEVNVGPWLVFEYMALGDLAQLLRSANGNQLCKKPSGYSLHQEDLHSIAEQIADGMAYLSSQHFVHRDLACRNCLVGERPDGSLTVKISDFGMSRDVYTCDYYKIGGSRMLPVRWMAPESILYGKFTLESDVWSFGVVIWEVFALGVQPYYGHSNEQVVKLILQGILLTPPERAPPLICDLLYGCWKTQPADRLTFAEIHSRLKSRMRRSESLETGVRTPSTVTYVHLRHDEHGDKPEYLQTLPDLPVHVYSNA